MKLSVLGVWSWITLATTVMILLLWHPASAAVTWNWSYSGKGLIGGSGTFTTSDVRADGYSYSITSIIGTVENQKIISLLPSKKFKDNDNLLYDTSQKGGAYGTVHYPPLSDKGVSFSTASALYSLSLFSPPPYGSGDFLLQGSKNGFAALVRFRVQRG